MINLSKENYINQGTFQKCYTHPENENLCIKIKINENHEDPRVDREIKYYKKIQKKKIRGSFLARYHGTIDTNYGLGYVYDLVKDETTNKISSTVAEYLNMPNSPISHDDLEFKFNEIKNKLIKYKIVIRDLTGKNVCCKIRKDNSIELVIIDGVGHRDFIPLVDWFQCFTKRKVNKIFLTKKLFSMEQHKNWLASNFD